MTVPRNPLTRRQMSAQLIGGAAAMATGLGVGRPAQAFWPALFAAALRGIGAAALRAGATRAAVGSVGPLTAQRRVQAAAAMRQLRPSLPNLRTTDSYFGTFTREFSGGVANEFGRVAARAVINYMRGGFGAVQAEGKPLPGYPEEDVVYGSFPNEGPADAPIILGCLEIYALNSLPRFLRSDFLAFGFDDPAIVHMLGFYPIRIEQLVHHDDDWVSLRPAVFRTPGCIIEMRSIRPSRERRYVDTTCRLGGSATRLYSARIPIDPQFS
jgi:hypothetical protein